MVVSAGSPLVLARVQSRARSQLRVLGPGAPAAPVVSVSGRRSLEASIARDAAGVYVAYRDGARRLVLASAAPAAGPAGHTGGCACAGAQRSPGRRPRGRRTLVATSRRAGRRYRIFLTSVGPAGTSVDRLTRGGGSDLAPLAATGPDGRVYVAWTHRAGRRARRAAVFRRVL